MIQFKDDSGTGTLRDAFIDKAENDPLFSEQYEAFKEKCKQFSSGIKSNEEHDNFRQLEDEFIELLCEYAEAFGRVFENVITDANEHSRYCLLAVVIACILNKNENL